ncbi:hypothetical protein AJ80_09352 [Polytolypa hystricis UAMH7299]|uniref:Ubiquitin-like protease family profile domain-containing protein n=1 Tax=Polytolypa hystricis (strain UAMH7299) TaxID=1447883 RepID=A0A2B7WS82_POLH7|nr:hypothetical protein AJ80_09352 [Polytolypa hystricis UAMH7299]
MADVFDPMDLDIIDEMEWEDTSPTAIRLPEPAPALFPAPALAPTPAEAPAPVLVAPPTAIAAAPVQPPRTPYKRKRLEPSNASETWRQMMRTMEPKEAAKGKERASEPVGSPRVTPRKRRIDDLEGPQVTTNDSFPVNVMLESPIDTDMVDAPPAEPESPTVVAGPAVLAGPAADVVPPVVGHHRVEQIVRQRMPGEWPDSPTRELPIPAIEYFSIQPGVARDEVALMSGALPAASLPGSPRVRVLDNEGDEVIVDMSLPVSRDRANDRTWLQQVPFANTVNNARSGFVSYIATTSTGRRASRLTRRIYQGAADVLGRSKRRAIVLWETYAPVKFSLARDRNINRRLTQDERHRMAADRFRRGRTPLLEQDSSFPAPIQTEEPTSPSPPSRHAAKKRSPSPEQLLHKHCEVSCVTKPPVKKTTGPAASRRRAAPGSTSVSLRTSRQAAPGRRREYRIAIPQGYRPLGLPPTQEQVERIEAFIRMPPTDQEPPHPLPTEKEAPVPTVDQEPPHPVPTEQETPAPSVDQEAPPEPLPYTGSLEVGQSGLLEAARSGSLEVARSVSRAVRRSVSWLHENSPNQRPVAEVRFYDPQSRIDTSSPESDDEEESSIADSDDELYFEQAVQPENELRPEELAEPSTPGPNEPFIKPLSAKWEAKVDAAMSLPNNRQVATTLAGDPLTRRDLATCCTELAWLNDEIINAYLALIVDYVRRKAGNAGRGEAPKYHAFNSFFFSNLRDKGYESVRRWASRAKIGKEALLLVEAVLVPVHDQSHWTLLVIKPRARTIEHFDSLGSLSQEHVATAITWLKAELGERFVEAEWRVLPSNSPQQNNGSDCGVFLLTSAKFSTLGLPLSYGARDTPLIRKRIAAELLNGGFEGDFDPGTEFPFRSML